MDAVDRGHTRTEARIQPNEAAAAAQQWHKCFSAKETKSHGEVETGMSYTQMLASCKNDKALMQEGIRRTDIYKKPDGLYYWRNKVN